MASKCKDSLDTINHTSSAALSSAGTDRPAMDSQVKSGSSSVSPPLPSAPLLSSPPLPSPPLPSPALSPPPPSSLLQRLLSSPLLSYPRLNVAAVVAACAAWIHGWISGLTHSDPLFTSANNTFKVYAWLFGLVVLLAWGHPVARRVVCTAAFALCSVFIMAVTSSVAWFRNPKHAGHLPDLVHDLVPSIDNVTFPYVHNVMFWLPVNEATGVRDPVVVGGLELAEGLMSTLVLITLAWSLTQNARWLILRRALIIYGTLALWRSVTIIVTAVPDASPRCSPTTPGTVHFLEMPWKDALSRGIAIVVGEMSDPCRSAGDMVFSGHSMVVVLCGMVWHAYYRVKPGTFVPNPVKMMIWALICVILFLIVAARYHYTLDVVLAVYFAVTIFNAYHRIADDVLIGHRFVAVWLFDGLLIYPAIEWLEAPELSEAKKAGMISRNTRLMAQLQAARNALQAAHIPPPPTPMAGCYDPAGASSQPQPEGPSPVGLPGVFSPLHDLYKRPRVGSASVPDAEGMHPSPLGILYALPRSIWNADGGFGIEPFDTSAPWLHQVSGSMPYAQGRRPSNMTEAQLTELLAAARR